MRGRFRVMAARSGSTPRGTAPNRAGQRAAHAAAEPRGEAMTTRLAAFRHDVILSKLRLLSMLCGI